MTQPLLQVRDLSVTFPARRGRPPVKAVDRVYFDILPGRTVGLVGESGSGKTTTGRAILQLDRKSTRLNSSHVSESRMPSSA